MSDSHKNFVACTEKHYKSDLPELARSLILFIVARKLINKSSKRLSGYSTFAFRIIGVCQSADLHTGERDEIY